MQRHLLAAHCVPKSLCKVLSGVHSARSTLSRAEGEQTPGAPRLWGWTAALQGASEPVCLRRSLLCHQLVRITLGQECTSVSPPVHGDNNSACWVRASEDFMRCKMGTSPVSPSHVFVRSCM